MINLPKKKNNLQPKKIGRPPRTVKQESITVKTVIKVLGAGAFLGASIVFPALPLAIKPILDAKREAERGRWDREWTRFNKWQLRQTIKRLQAQQMVKVIDKTLRPRVVLTKKGRSRYLEYSLEDMMIKRPAKWDGKWRLVIYDISKHKKKTQEVFRETLKRLKFYPLQKSVYIYPFPCKEEISFFRHMYGLEDDIRYLVVESLEYEEAFRKFFDV